ncbi:MAG: hypothetical protein A3F70_12035 [Acidobacteria bacterium RIFCSPLOWO2_12_FULL_67_14]|nr:MAG: hypothetical protein A3F70_12035 [Acidobacteria bacterium RIFCSPLOWO2_12_FULL_67_14]
MSVLVALDVAILPPSDVGRRALELSAALPEEESLGLCLGAESLPHVTLVQQYVAAGDLDLLYAALDAALTNQPPLTLTVTGGGRSGVTVWMAIDPAPGLVRLHERLMGSLHRFERSDGNGEAFFGGNARAGDVAWVSTYRRKASLLTYRPHITLGHARQPPHVDPFTFEATVVAACHLGRSCTCRRVLRAWDLR